MLSPAILSLTLAAAATSEPPRIAVLELDANGASAELASAIGGSVAHELQQLGVFRVTTPDSVRALLSVERQRQLLGGTEGTPVGNALSEALGADFVLHGRVSHLAGNAAEAFSFELDLDDAHAGRREGSDVEKAASPAELLGRVGKAVSKVAAKLLADRTGRLFVDASEPGAVVKVDDVAMGTTPLPGSLALPGGPHQLVVEKAGFIAIEKQVRIRPDELSEEKLTLVPSADYIEEHEGHAQKMRIGAWVASVVGVAGLGTAAAFQLRADHLYGAVGQPGTFLDDRAKLAAGDETFRAPASSLQTQITSSQNLSFVAGGVGLVGAGVAAYLWIAGDDPGRYARFKAIVPKVAVIPAPGGAVGVLTWQ